MYPTILYLVLSSLLISTGQTPVIEGPPEYVFEGSVMTLKVSNLEINQTYFIQVEDVGPLLLLALEEIEYVYLSVRDRDGDNLLFIALLDSSYNVLTYTYINIRDIGGIPASVFISFFLPLLVLVIILTLILLLYNFIAHTFKIKRKKQVKNNV